MLLSLNDDCLLYICEFLSYFDQSSLAHTCQRLQLIVEENWRHKSKIVMVDNEQCSQFSEKNPEYFQKFMKCISANVEDLEFVNIKCNIFHTLKELQFPKVTQLAIDFHYSEFNKRNDDENTELISKLFPQTTKLSIISGMSGKYLWNLTNLTELNIGGCEYLMTEYFEQIFSTLHLKKLNIMFYSNNTCFDELAADIAECSTLEEIYIDDHHLMILVDQLPKLKKLRKLVIYTRNYSTYLLETIVQQSGDTIDSITFDCVFRLNDLHRENVIKMHNLRRLILHNDEIESNQLITIGAKLGNTLKEFRYVKGGCCTKMEDGLIEFLTYCKHLEILDISNSEFNINIFRRAIEVVSVNLKNRRNPLIIRCFNTNITEEDAEILTIPNVIEFELAKEQLIFPGTSCFAIEWK